MTKCKDPKKLLLPSPKNLARIKRHWHQLVSNEGVFEVSQLWQARDLLLAVYIPFHEEVSLKDYRTIEHRWNLRLHPHNLDEFDVKKDSFSKSIYGSYSAAGYGEKESAIMLPDPHRNLILSQLGFVQFSKPENLKRQPKSKTNVNQKEPQEVKVYIPSTPKVLCILDLNASNEEILESIETVRKTHNIKRPTDKTGRAKGGRPKNRFQIEVYYLDTLLKLQKGQSISEIFKLLKEKYNLKTLSLDTFGKQTKSLLKFIDPQGIGHKNGVLRQN